MRPFQGMILQYIFTLVPMTSRREVILIHPDPDCITQLMVVTTDKPKKVASTAPKQAISSMRWVTTPVELRL